MPGGLADPRRGAWNRAEEAVAQGYATRVGPAPANDNAETPAAAVAAFAKVLAAK